MKKNTLNYVLSGIKLIVLLPLLYGVFDYVVKLPEGFGIVGYLGISIEAAIVIFWLAISLLVIFLAVRPFVLEHEKCK